MLILIGLTTFRSEMKEEETFKRMLIDGRKYGVVGRQEFSLFTSSDEVVFRMAFVYLLNVKE